MPNRGLGRKENLGVKCDISARENGTRHLRGEAVKLMKIPKVVQRRVKEETLTCLTTVTELLRLERAFCQETYGILVIMRSRGHDQ